MITNILIIVVILLITVNLVMLFNLNKNSKSNTSTLSSNDINEIKKVVMESYTAITSAIVNSIATQNRNFIEQINDKLKELKEEIEKLNKSNNDFQIKMLDNNTNNIKAINESMKTFENTIKKGQDEEITKLNNAFKDINELISKNNDKSIKDIKEKLDEFSKLIKDNMDNIRKDNNEKLEKIQNVVDDNLKKTLEERLNSSFKNVLEQISGVNQAIGEIKGLATDVSSLKNVLANVKTKGIVGEVILGNLIREILTKDQYEENVVTKAGSNDRVEFAIKMPGSKEGESIYLPVDSKFPTEAYHRIQEAIDKADKDGVEAARKELKANIITFAKDISSKYIDAPNTTAFAIMFLPIEGLYAEVINMGLFEELQRNYNVSVTGPSTFSALLNALQMGFKSLVIQKKSADVFKLLTSIKTEFDTFADALDKTQKKFNQAGDELEKLVGTRTRAMQRKLKNVESIEEIKELENK